MNPVSTKISNRTILIISGVVLLLITVVAIMIYYNGKKAGKAEGSINVAGSVEDSSGGAQASVSDLKALAGQIHADMEGGNPFGHDVSLWQRVSTLSDTDLAKLYTEFDYQYQKDSGQTLVGWISSEPHMPFDSWGTIKGILLPRFAKLNLS